MKYQKNIKGSFEHMAKNKSKISDTSSKNSGEIIVLKEEENVEIMMERFIQLESSPHI